MRAAGKKVVSLRAIKTYHAAGERKAEEIGALRPNNEQKKTTHTVANVIDYRGRGSSGAPAVKAGGRGSTGKKDDTPPTGPPTPAPAPGPGPEHDSDDSPPISVAQLPRVDPAKMSANFGHITSVDQFNTAVQGILDNISRLNEDIAKDKSVKDGFVKINKEYKKIEKAGFRETKTNLAAAKTMHDTWRAIAGKLSPLSEEVTKLNQLAQFASNLNDNGYAEPLQNMNNGWEAIMGLVNKYYNKFYTAQERDKAVYNNLEYPMIERDEKLKRDADAAAAGTAPEAEEGEWDMVKDMAGDYFENENLIAGLKKGTITPDLENFDSKEAAIKNYEDQNQEILDEVRKEGEAALEKFREFLRMYQVGELVPAPPETAMDV